MRLAPLLLPCLQGGQFEAVEGRKFALRHASAGPDGLYVDFGRDPNGVLDCLDLAREVADSLL